MIKLKVVIVFLLLLSAGVCQQPVPPQVRVVDIIPKSLSWETNQDSEPFLAVSPTNPLTMVVSAFTPNPLPTAPTSPVFVSEDGGRSWALRNIVPIPEITVDITHSMGSGGTLYAGALKPTAVPGRDPRPDLQQLFTKAVHLNEFMKVQNNTRLNVDQPFTTVTVDRVGDRILVGDNDLGSPNDKTASVEVSVDGGARYRTVVLENRKTSGQNGPSVRISSAKDGTIYAAYFGWRKYQKVDRFEGWITSDIVVARDDRAAKVDDPFQDLKDPKDKLPGRIVASGRQIHWSNKATLGEERIGSTLSIAVDPNLSSRVYISWADNFSDKAVYAVHLFRSEDKGQTWKETWNPLPNTVCAALAISDSGVVGYEYQQLVGRKWITHLVQSADDFATSPQDTVLASVSADLPNQGWPYIGDYNYLVATAHEFRGAFSANNRPERGNFPPNTAYLRDVDWLKGILLDDAGNEIKPSIDPFFFSVEVIDATLSPKKALRSTR